MSLYYRDILCWVRVPVRVTVNSTNLIYWGSSVMISPGVTMSSLCFARLAGRPMLMAVSPSRSTPPSESESDDAPSSRPENRESGFGCMIVMGILEVLVLEGVGCRNRACWTPRGLSLTDLCQGGTSGSLVTYCASSAPMDRFSAVRLGQEVQR